jgi:effector-binding domain-containing protein
VTLLPIGRFAKASRLSVKALRHYDEAALLRPSYVDPTSGYRYYRIEQLARATTIRSLRVLDMPLSRIAEVLGEDAIDGGPSALQTHLESHLQVLIAEREQYEQKILELQRIISRQELIMSTSVTIKVIDAQVTATFRATPTHATIFEAIPQGFASVFAYLEQVGATPTGIPFTLFHEFPDGETAGEISLCVPIDADLSAAEQTKTIGISTFNVDGGAVASILHKGSYASMDSSYATIAAWIHERGHRVIGASREIYLNNPADVAESDLLTEIQWPIDA